MPHTLSDFDYILPESLIAQHPAEPRDHSRLLVYDRKSRSLTDDYFYNLPAWLPENSVLAINNSRVEKARLLFGKKEVFITRVIDPYTAEAMIRPGKAFRSGRSIELAAVYTQEDKTQFQERTQQGSKTEFQERTQQCSKTLYQDAEQQNRKQQHLDNKQQADHQPVPPIRAEVLHIADDGLRTLRFNYPIDHSVFEPYRRTPFPPYIRPNESLADRYQTVYAKDDGSKAAPTAGLHFTDRLFQELSRKSISKVELTLHVGLGTFAPVKTESIDRHKMHSEWFRITREAAGMLGQAPHITAVGTTSARVLESAVLSQAAGRKPLPNKSKAISNEIRFRDFTACEEYTDIFITPGYRFRAVDSLITNFHLPKSTLLMMIAAFTGLDEMHRIYRHAIREEYRFYSFGDAMLLL